MKRVGMQKHPHSQLMKTLMAAIFGCYAAFVLIINLLKSLFTRVHEHYISETMLSNPVMMLCGGLFVLLVYLIFNQIDKHRNAIRRGGLRERNVVLLTGAAFFLLQMYLVYNYCFETDWDVQILLDSARHIANGQHPNHNGWYYGNYPNNLFLTELFASILWITKSLH